MPTINMMIIALINEMITWFYRESRNQAIQYCKSPSASCSVLKVSLKKRGKIDVLEAAWWEGRIMSLSVT